MSFNLSLAVKPIWLLSTGALLGVVAVYVLWLVLGLVNRRVGETIRDVLRQSHVWPVWSLAHALGIFVIVTTLIEPFSFYMFGIRVFDRKMDAVVSVLRLPTAGESKSVHLIPPDAENHFLPLRVPRGELKELRLTADENLRVTVNQPDSTDLPEEDRIVMVAHEPFEWRRSVDATGAFIQGVEGIYVTNVGDPTGGRDEAKLTATVVMEVTVPQARMIPITAAALVGFVALFVLLQLAAPKVAAMTNATAKETIWQPMFLLTLSVGAVLLLAFLFVPYFTFGEDFKAYKDAGMTLIKVLAMIVAVWTASVSVAEEIEGRTALTVLSKPIGRPQFLLGKFAGITAAVGMKFILLGVLLMACVSYKITYDARESGNPNVVWQDCHQEVAHTVGGLALGWMETAVLASVSVALSTRLVMLPNLLICASFYVLGNLVPLLVESTVGRFEVVQFMGRFLAVVIPNLELFNPYPAIAQGVVISTTYIALMCAYTLCYSAMAMLLGLAMFEGRDLA